MLIRSVLSVLGPNTRPSARRAVFDLNNAEPNRRGSKAAISSTRG